MARIVIDEQSISERKPESRKPGDAVSRRQQAPSHAHEFVASLAHTLAPAVPLPPLYRKTSTPLENRFAGHHAGEALIIGFRRTPQRQ